MAARLADPVGRVGLTLETATAPSSSADSEAQV